MKEIVIPILTFLGGFYVKQFFDNRDLRRKILEPVFEKFEKNIIYLQTEWRNIQAANINHEDFDGYDDTYNAGREKLITSKTNIIFACKKIEEKELIPLIEEAFGTIIEGISGYSFFLEQRDNAPIAQRKELIQILKDAGYQLKAGHFRTFLFLIIVKQHIHVGCIVCTMVVHTMHPT